MKRTDKKIISGIIYAYLILPFLIFVGGWIRLRYAIPIMGIVFVSYVLIIKESEKLWVPELNKDNIVKILFILVCIFIWVYFSGIGRFVFQNTDHNCRNAIFDVLVNRSWPVVNFNILPDGYFAGESATGLIYYIGFWLPAACFGKIFGLKAGYGFQYFWAVFGILLVYYLICARAKKLEVWPLAILIFFSGLDIVGWFSMNANIFTVDNMQHLENWMSPYQYSSMTTQLFWVFNQVIPAWLCTLLAYMQKNNRNIVFVLASVMLTSTFPFVGLLVLVGFWVFTRKYTDLEWKGIRDVTYWKYWIKDTFTFQNVLGGGAIGIISFIYLSSNASGQRFMAKSTFGAVLDNNLLKWIVFIILEIGVYAVILYKYNKANGLYYLILLCLCIIPPIKVGNSIDFCMRASIPALFILLIFVMDAIKESRKKKDNVIFAALVIALFIGGVTPLHEFTRTIANTVDRVNHGQQVYESSIDEVQLLNGRNFSGSTEDNFFFQHLARHTWED